MRTNIESVKLNWPPQVHGTFRLGNKKSLVGSVDTNTPLNFFKKESNGSENSLDFRCQRNDSNFYVKINSFQLQINACN